MLLVFSDDWGRHPSSCQHLVTRLLPRHKVVWVNTIGMRPPRLNLATFGRGLEKMRDWSRGAGPLDSANPLVLNPQMWPWFRRRHDRWLNLQLLLRALVPVIEKAGEPVDAVTTIPLVADLIGKLPVPRWLYYCVDDFTVWPGLDHATILRLERELVAKCDAIVSVSETLTDRLEELGRTPKLLTHGVDLDFWRGDRSSSEYELPKEAEPPLVVFWGVVDRRMNVSWVRQLADDMQAGTILLVGPKDNPDEALFNHKRIVHVPPLLLDQLPGIARRAAALVMPYADLPVTRAMQPLKLKEYLATGKPVVVSDLPATRPWADCLDVAYSAEEFSALVRRRIEQGVDSGQTAARRRLESEGWESKSQLFERWILGNEAHREVA